MQSRAKIVNSVFFIKVFGVIYNIYMTNKTGFGDEGNAIYMSGYQIYALLLTVSSIGVFSIKQSKVALAIIAGSFDV